MPFTFTQKLTRIGRPQNINTNNLMKKHVN